MNKVLHLLSESAIWLTESEFTDLARNRSLARGESHIEASETEITNTSWAEMADGKRITNTYSIQKSQENLYHYQSVNPALGIQTGTFVIDRNYVYSKFSIADTQLNGFEVIVREDNICRANGALYDGDKLINTWVATMIRK